MMWRLAVVWFGLLLSIASPHMAAAQKRVALIIGNGAYVKVPKLDNPKNDAAAIEGMLTAAGFDTVVKATDLGIVALRRALRDFSDTAHDADIAVVFYAGHGMEVMGTNYLIPVDAVLERDLDVQDEAVSLERVSQVLEGAKRLRLVILDACRDNPFVRTMRRTIATRSVRSGYTEIDERSLPPNTLIAYAQRSGQTAEDGTGKNSPYTTALLTHLPTPGLDIELALRRVRDDVLKLTRNRQEPYKYGSLSGTEMALVASRSAALASSTVEAAGDAQLELALWSSVKDSDDINVLQTYIDRFPNGTFAGLAKVRISRLKPEAVPVAAKTAPRIAPGSSSPAGSTPTGRSLTLPVKILPRDGKGWIAVRLTSNESVLQAMAPPGGGGTIVLEAQKGGPAETAGMLPGDVITRYDGHAVTDGRSLAKMVAETTAEKTVSVDVWRIGNGAADVARLLQVKAGAGDKTAVVALAYLHSTTLFGTIDNTEVVRWYRKAADSGDVAAMQSLAGYYRTGRGVEKNETEAVRLYRVAADSGNTAAMHALGEMVAAGRGIAKDEAEAARWYRRAADAGFAPAMRDLGIAYSYGRGVARDDTEALRLFRASGEAGDRTGMANVGVMYETGRGTARDDAEAVRWHRKAAEAGYAYSMQRLGILIGAGRGTAKDDAEAVQWLRKAADAGDAAGMRSLAVRYANGTGVPKDEAEALRLFRKSAEAGDRAAMSNLGVIYENGRGVAKDESEAVRWYKKGAEAGSPSGMYALGLMYQSGRGVGRDVVAASQWVLKAVQAGDTTALEQVTSNGTGWNSDFRREMQNRLKEAGVYSGPIDGNFGPATKAAIEEFKKKAK